MRRRGLSDEYGSWNTKLDAPRECAAADRRYILARRPNGLRRVRLPGCPAASSASVDLPEPDSATSPSTSPFAADRSTLLTARRICFAANSPRPTANVRVTPVPPRSLLMRRPAPARTAAPVVPALGVDRHGLRAMGRAKSQRSRNARPRTSPISEGTMPRMTPSRSPGPCGRRNRIEAIQGRARAGGAAPRTGRRRLACSTISFPRTSRRHGGDARRRRGRA